jgi:hypothetical protein
MGLFFNTTPPQKPAPQKGPGLLGALFGFSSSQPVKQPKKGIWSADPNAKNFNPRDPGFQLRPDDDKILFQDEMNDFSDYDH